MPVQLWLENLLYLQLVLCIIQQISDLVIIHTIHYLTTSHTITLRIHVLDEGPILLFAVQRWGKITSYSKNLTISPEKMNED